MKILQEVLRRSKEEYELEAAHRIEEKEEVASTSSSLSETLQGTAVTQQINSMNGTSEDQELKDSDTAAVKSSDKPTSSCKEKLAAVKVSAPGSANCMTSESLKDTESSKGFTEEEGLQQRSEYLKAQRDKLQALKKDQTLKNTTETTPVTPDPRPLTQEMSVEEKKKLQKRKHLAEKLKEEVIKK